jgi:hypothetical protein
MALSEFAWCNNYDSKITALSGLCVEKWTFGDNSDNVILKNYIEYTFRKLLEEHKVIEDATYCVFNTGLYTEFYEPIYAYFTPNRIPDRQKWFLDSFYTPYTLAFLGITELPGRANYFSDPAALVFDTNCEIVPQYKHIFNPVNLMRIPQTIREGANKKILFDGAIKRATGMINANYKTAVPQYFDKKIQLLIPIFLRSENTPDLALVVTRVENKYIGHTCLTLDLAYNNARLIARPDSAWLKP